MLSAHHYVEVNFWWVLVSTGYMSWRGNRNVYHVLLHVSDFIWLIQCVVSSTQKHVNRGRFFQTVRTNFESSFSSSWKIHFTKSCTNWFFMEILFSDSGIVVVMATAVERGWKAVALLASVRVFQRVRCSNLRGRPLSVDAWLSVYYHSYELKLKVRGILNISYVLRIS